MFIGQYSNKIDEKNRLAIPVKFRSQLAGGAVITIGLDGCLFIYTTDEWDKLAQQLTTLPLTAANARAFSRFLLANATEIELDRQGRVVLPSHLRSSANIKSQVVVAGLMNRLEIWDESRFSEYQAKTAEASVEIAEELML